MLLRLFSFTMLRSFHDSENVVIEIVKRFRFYKGRPVKHMRHGRKDGVYGLILFFVSKAEGEVNERLLITQDDWDKFGEWRNVESDSLPYIRKKFKKFI